MQSGKTKERLMKDIFDPITVKWFKRAIGKPTKVQEEAWPVIAAGHNTLVSAPTGTGKTLSSFLVYIDRLMAMARKGTLKNQLQLIYISPLKSLAGDIRENLRRPLDGIREEEERDPPPGQKKTPELKIMIRTGDTPQSERRKMLKSPPHILITTPESLYLLLTGKASQAVLKTAKWIIIDELHALIDSKRGAHLMLSLARLDRLCERPLQRIGLSATVRPLKVAAEYLSPEPAVIVAPQMKKELKLIISSPLPPDGVVRKDSVWQEIAASVYAQCKEGRSAIAFVEGRAYAEKLAYYVNQIGGEGFARTHHGSLSKEQRFQVENELRSGRLRLLCATSSMELGIDVGDIDQVFQVGCPRSISSTMQRLGRAGHNPNRTSVMYIFTRVPLEGLYSGLTAEVVRRGGIEYSRPPRLCLDVLAQHLVSMAAGEGYTVDEIMELLLRAYPFKDVTREDVKELLCMLAGDYEHRRDIPVRPRVLYDRIHERVEGDPYSRMLAVSAGGTIPDKGMYSVKTENGVTIGELHEEYVFEAREGDKFLLGTFAWQITDIGKDAVTVKEASLAGARPPFWKDELKGRRLETGFIFGEIFRRLAETENDDELWQELSNLGLDEAAVRYAHQLIRHQLGVTGVLPDDKTIMIEHYKDETGIQQMMVHSVFGKPVNEPLAILLAEAAKRITNTNINYLSDDDGILLFPYEDHQLPEGLFSVISPETAGAVLSAALPVTARFNMSFRYNAARALMMGVRKTGRQPLWVQRMRSAELLDSIIKNDSHPLIKETKRECLEDYWDLQGLNLILSRIQTGEIRVCEMRLLNPSPMSHSLRYQAEASMLYDYTPTTSGVVAAVEAALSQTEMIAPAPEQLQKINEASHGKRPENEAQLHTLLMIEGDLTPGELELPLEWFENLEESGLALYIEPGLWIAAEQAEEYESALNGRVLGIRAHIVRRLLRYRGAQTARLIAQRYFFTEDEAEEVLKSLIKSGEAIEFEGLYYHAKLFDRARRETVKQRRNQIKTLPAERFAALLAGRLIESGTAAEKMEAALKSLCGYSYPPELWENVIFPARVGDYRPELLDRLLSQGEYIWTMEKDGGLSFHAYEDINWEAEPEAELGGSEKILFETLKKQGASFINRLSSALNGASPYEPLLSLAEKGLVTADSFVPVRNLINKTKLDEAPIRQRIKSRVSTLTSGRWELVRPLKELTIGQQLDRAFDRYLILSKETAQGISWAEAVKVLRLWEYTGQVRRGYFIEGLSGMQFIRERDFAGVTFALSNLQQEGSIVWLPAIDHLQPWGKFLAHREGRAFMNVPGTAVALKGGAVAAVFERQGKSLTVFESDCLAAVLDDFVKAFRQRRLYPSVKRIMLKQYPKEAEEALTQAGFTREMQDFVLYRTI